jgi:hypothetical protein
MRVSPRDGLRSRLSYSGGTGPAQAVADAGRDKDEELAGKLSRGRPTFVMAARWLQSRPYLLISR